MARAATWKWSPHWPLVQDLDRNVVEVREALEETQAHGIRFKVCKTASGIRDVSLPDIAVDALREHRKQQVDALGLGKPPENALVFSATLSDSPISPMALTHRWRRAAASIGIRGIGFHA